MEPQLSIQRKTGALTSNLLAESMITKLGVSPEESQSISSLLHALCVTLSYRQLRTTLKAARYNNKNPSLEAALSTTLRLGGKIKGDIILTPVANKNAEGQTTGIDISIRSGQELRDRNTGLFSREMLEGLLPDTIAAAFRTKRSVGLLILSSRQKLRTDTLSLPSDTDSREQEIAQCLTDHQRTGDIMSSLGGGQFGILLPDIPDQQRLAKAATRYASAIHRCTDLPICMGVAEYIPGNEHSLERQSTTNRFNAETQAQFLMIYADLGISEAMKASVQNPLQPIHIIKYDQNTEATFSNLTTAVAVVPNGTI